MSATTTDAMPTTAPNKALHYGLWAVQLLLGLMFLGAGLFKATTPPADILAAGMAWAGRVPPMLVPFIGVSEFLGGVGLILPSALRIAPKVSALAAAGLVTIMILAAIEHGLAGEYGAVGFNFVLGSMAAFVVWGRAVGAPIAPRV